MIKIVVDCFGGDHSPNANVVGAAEALKRHDDMHLILTGDKSVIEKELSALEYDKERLTI